MRDLLKIFGGLVCAVTALIPFINKSGDYSMTETVLNASGMYIGAGLVLLGNSLDFKSKSWWITMTISVILLIMGIIWYYDNFIDLKDRIHTYGYAVILAVLTLLTIAICLFYKLRQKRQLT